MSMPSYLLQCNRCDAAGGEMMLWGDFRYRLDDGQEFPLHRRLGWCEHCQKIGPMEDFRKESEVREELQTNQTKLAIADQPSTWDRLMQYIQPSSRVRIEKLRTEIREAENLLSLIKQRDNKERCLGCGTENAIPITLRPGLKSSDLDQEGRCPSGFIHPGCGGELILEDSGMRFNVRLKTRVYSKSAQLISEGYRD